MCFTISKMLSDNNTVVALDFTFSDMQKSILKMTDNSDSTALIVNKNGMIIGYTDMSLVGENISKKLPVYESILDKVIHQSNHSSFTTQVDDSTRTIFSSETNNGWYMILSVDNWTLYKDNYRQVAFTAVVSILMIVVIIILYLNGMKNKLQAEQALHIKEEFLSHLSEDLHEPLRKILNLSATNTSDNSSQIRESALQLSGMLNDLFTFSKMVSAESENIDKKHQNLELSKTGHKVRNGVITVLIVSMIFSMTVSSNNIMSWGDTKMNREVDVYNYQLSNWIAKHKSILSMFTSMVSERPTIMDNYEQAVTWLNDIAKNYPEISACYLANPYKEHNVIMNNGWEGPEGWKVEERPWYIESEKSEDGFSISAPYYDDQTGLYCVTFSQVVYGKNGEFLGIFGIDFFLDKLIHILDESYTKDSYAFLVDRNGIIINHPSDDFQLGVDNTTPITITNYAPTYYNGNIITINDYNDKRSACLAKKNTESDFTVVFVNDWWNIYGNIIVLGALILFLFGIGIIAVSVLINRLLNWQQDVNLQLKQAADTAVAAGQAKSQFLAQMSHEIRTPINAVIGMNEMILRECKDASILKYSRNVAQASEALLSLINDILDFSKIESGKMELVEETYKFDEMLKNLINMIKPRAEKKNLEFILNVNENIPNELFGDSVRIRQVVINFLTNAVKYTKVGSVTFSVDMESKTDDTVMLKFSVKDTGIGIRDEDKKRLFKDFERFDSHQNKNIEGTGLGLAITKKLVDMMKGRVQVDSVYGEGSTFMVMIPQKIMGTELIGNFNDKLKLMPSTQQTYSASFIAPDAKILVVDDNEMNLLVVTSLLKQTQIKVDTAMSGMSALKKLADNYYDVIFLDQMMPSLDGIQTLHLAKEMPNNKSIKSPVIALTANAISGAREMFLSEGFTDYLTKPINSQEMEQMLINYLPVEKIQTPEAVETETQSTDEPVNSDTNNYEYLNVGLGLQYSANMLDMYKNILSLFCQMKNEKQLKIQEAYNNENWQDYTTFVHALKSTALSVGGEKISAAAKQLETAGKIIISNTSSELEKHQSIEYIKQHHEEAMRLYDLLVSDGNRFLGNDTVETEETETKPVENIENITNDEISATAENVTNDVEESTPSQTYENINTELGVHECSDMPEVYVEMLKMFCEDKDTQQEKLKQAFDEGNWQDYISAIQELESSAYTIGGEKLSKLLKSIETACKMLTSDFTSEAEKQQSIDYIKQHHEEAIQLYDALVDEGNNVINKI